MRYLAVSYTRQPLTMRIDDYPLANRATEGLSIQPGSREFRVFVCGEPGTFLITFTD